MPNVPIQLFIDGVINKERLISVDTRAAIVGAVLRTMGYVDAQP